MKTKYRIFSAYSLSLQALVLAMLGLAMSACHQSQEPDPAPEPEPQVGVRTVLVYMVAANNLDYDYHADTKDLAEMQQAAAEGQLRDGHLLVYHAPYSGSPVLKEITATGIDTLKIYNEDVVSVSINQMRTVIADAKELAPSRDYGMVLWSHASGWLQDGIDEASSGPATYSYGIDHNRRMSISSLAEALDGQELEFVYFDCCYMGSIETLYELRHTAKEFVASVFELSLWGMPYHQNMKYLFADTPDLQGAAKNSYDFYAATYNPKNDCPISYAYIKAEHLDELARATRQIYEQASTPYPAGYSPQKCSRFTPCYYYDFADYVKALCASEDQYLAWKAIYDKAVPYAEGSESICGQVAIKTFCGLSTYIIKDKNSISTKNYHTLEWYNDVAGSLVSDPS